MRQQPDSFDPVVVSDPEIFSINRMAAHSDHCWYADEDEAARFQSSFVTVLDGTWKYHHASCPSDLPENLELASTDIASWEDIAVPGHIQLQGYDRPQYVNYQYPWDGHETVEAGQAPRLYNPISTYATNVYLPRLGIGERISLVLDGAESAVAVWVDGVFVGYSTDSFTPSEFDVTNFADGSHHRLVCRVWKWSSGSWLEDHDFFRFSGIFRSVRLLRRPRIHVEDLAINVRLKPNLDTAQVSIECTGAGMHEARIHAHLTGVGDFLEDGRKLVITVTDPHLWSAEDPYLYRAIVTVADEKGEIVEVITQNVGIRSVGIEDGLLLINGRRAFLKGVNRHEFGPGGRVPDEQLLLEDLKALKRVGVNAIRASHYPNSSAFYDLCDRLGFYVIDEASVETHGMWDRIIRGRASIEEAIPGDSSRWRPAVQDRLTSMVRRDRNHPSVILWSLGNESLGGSVFKDVADYVRGIDSRPIHYEGVHWDPRYPETTDITSQMYTSSKKVEQYLRHNVDKPFILCEFAHAMGNSFGAVDRYIDLMRKIPHFQGVFVWDFADQALMTYDEEGRPFWGYGGDFGESPHDGDFCGNGLFFADRTPSPQLQALKAIYQPLIIGIDQGGITVVNEFEVTRTNIYRCVVSLEHQGTLLERHDVEVDIGPTESVHLPLPFQLPETPGEYAVDVRFLRTQACEWAEVGTVVARQQRVVTIGQECSRLSKIVSSASLRPAPILVDSTHNIGVRGDDFEVLFSRIHGGIQSYFSGQWGHSSRQLLRGMPTVNMWHAPTSNERGWGAPMIDAQWLVASRYWKARGDLDPFSVRRADDCVEVEWVLDLGSNPTSTCHMRARVYVDSTLILSARLEAGEGLGDPPEFGFLIPVDPRLRHLKWYGEGPQESAVDRRNGAFLGVYETDVESTLTPYLRPQECGSRTGVRWARLTDDEGFGIEILSDSTMEFSALKASPFEIENAQHLDEIGIHRRTWLRPALMRRGVGGDDSWGAQVHDEYRLADGPLDFTCAMRIIHPQKYTGIHGPDHVAN
ncbi:glycoside hydrolase family 2 TIM barrel-domain containing protein [Schaalia vaccimaxillae]|uniref:glycoside hydrolase family 2 TIM barrel-domain containing protein n=1 Tax=Schaalia vaccimaxillae TaxID=183916 RepID=UPI0003B7482C|nr:glycoside hydrolase family 2 TIM barrel-domain containing protein [Schaalia vaccimaxillae]